MLNTLIMPGQCNTRKTCLLFLLSVSVLCFLKFFLPFNFLNDKNGHE